MTPPSRKPPLPKAIYKRFTQIILLSVCVILCHTLFNLHRITNDVTNKIRVDDTLLRNDVSNDQSLDIVESIPKYSKLDLEIIQNETMLKQPKAEKAAMRPKKPPKPNSAVEWIVPGEEKTYAASAATLKPCPGLAMPRSLRIINGVWQQFNTTSTPRWSFHMLSAYLDDREGVGPVPLVRILMTSNMLEPPPLHCLLWYRGSKEPVRTRGRFLHIWVDEWGNFDHLHEPYILSCPIGSTGNDEVDKHPVGVSLIENNCNQPLTVLPIMQNRPKTKHEFAVCAKALFFRNKDISIRLVEWFETLFLLGVHKIFIYEHAVHPNISKVLRHYATKGLVTVIPFSFPTGDGFPPDDITGVSLSIIQQKRKFEMIPLNDCLYRNLYSHEYIAVLDADEIIVPTEDDNWSLMMARLTEEPLYQGFRFRNAYFMDDMTLEGVDNDVDQIPEYMHMLKHVYRAKNISEPGYYVKSITATKLALVIHNHFPVKCLTENYFCSTQEVSLSVGRMQHYRKGCTHDVLNCRVYLSQKVKDTSLWKYKEDLLRNTANVLRALRLIV